MDQKKLHAIFISELSLHPISIRRISGGYNCRLYKVIVEDKSEFLVKEYNSKKENDSNRLRVEFTSLLYLWKKGIRAIPKPVYMRLKESIGIYSFLPGKPLKKGDYSNRDIYSVIEFWQKLHRLSKSKGSNKLPVAKDACFTIRRYKDSIDMRLERLLHKTPLQEKKLHLFLKKEFVPIYEKVWERISDYCKRKKISMYKILPVNYRTFSPSDFGFHNAFRKLDGSLVFYDFEYFGWDDPAKLIADFYLHPKIKLRQDKREIIYRNIYTTLSDSSLSARLPLVYLLLSLKWCLIMLNIFLYDNPQETKNAKTRQQKLIEAKKQLHNTLSDLNGNSFPLSLITL